MTWNRTASNPPADPGYGIEDQAHPAHQPDPAYAKYKNGDPSSWAEDPRKGPYPDGNDPADPGYGVEDQDHPAHVKEPTWPKIELQKVAALRKTVEKKAAKCVHIAKAMLGKTACDMEIEDQALDLMDLPDVQLDATLARMGGGFMAEEDESVEELVEDDEGKEASDKLASVLAELDALKKKVADLDGSAKKAEKGDQNDPEGPTLGETGKTPEQREQVVMKEQEAIDQESKVNEKQASRNLKAWLAGMDTDNDSFITREDWSGSRKLFASLDTDNDGIIAVDEALKVMVADDEKEEDEDDDPATLAMIAEMVAKKAEDEKPEDKKEEVKEEEGEGKVADMFAPVDDPMGLGEEPVDISDDSMLDEIFGCNKNAAKKAKKSEDEEIKEEVEQEEAVEGKKAKKSDDDGDADDEGSVEDPEEDEKEAGKKASLRPQAPKPRAGVRTLGSVTRTASAGGEVAELSKLWQSAEDVSAVFGMKKS
jgi:hypothetical protein